MRSSVACLRHGARLPIETQDRKRMTRAVLTFHSIDDSGSVLSFPPRSFARLIERLAATKTPVVTFDELSQRDHGVTITFDDGMRSVYEHALPVLREHGFAAHLFLVTGRVGRDWPSRLAKDGKFEMVEWSDVEECAHSGIRIECHTATHPDLRNIIPQRILDECQSADDEIELRIGRRPTLMAFPFGSFDDAVIGLIGPRYRACFTTRLGYLTRKIDFARVPRLDAYYLQAPFWNEHLLSAPTRGYLALRAAIRAVRGAT